MCMVLRSSITRINNRAKVLQSKANNKGKIVKNHREKKPSRAESSFVDICARVQLTSTSLPALNDFSRLIEQTRNLNREENYLKLVHLPFSTEMFFPSFKRVCKTKQIGRQGLQSSSGPLESSS